MVSRSMVFQTWAALEERATALSIPHLTVADLDEARSANGRLAERCRVRDLDGYRTAASDFHSLLSSRCPNRRLVTLARQESLVPRIPSHGRRSQRWWDYAEQAVWEHELLLDLVAAAAGNAEINACLREHRTHMIELALREETADDASLPAARLHAAL